MVHSPRGTYTAAALRSPVRKSTRSQSISQPQKRGLPPSEFGAYSGKAKGRTETPGFQGWTKEEKMDLSKGESEGQQKAGVGYRGAVTDEREGRGQAGQQSQEDKRQQGSG